MGNGEYMRFCDGTCGYRGVWTVDFREKDLKVTKREYMVILL